MALVRHAAALIAGGFTEDTDEDAPPCRWVVRIKVDVMPTRLDVLGFTNRWYAPAMAARADLDCGR